VSLNGIGSRRVSILYEGINHLVIFSIDEHRYALPLSAVQRIVHSVEITPLPESPDIVPGVINVQGRIIPVVDVRKRFHLPERDMDLSDQLIIAHISGRSIALLVDTVGEILQYMEQEMVRTEEILPGMDYIKGVVKSENSIISVLDPDTVLSINEVKSLDETIKENPEG